MDDDDPLGSHGLSQILLEHKPVFDHYFAACKTKLSDYTFANTFIWREAIRLGWRLIHDCLCVFGNGAEGLTMLFPPVGKGDFVAAVRESIAICEDYNASMGLTDATRLEYVTDEMRLQLPDDDFVAQPMSGDYVYETPRMIDLEGGDLASKRQCRNRFARRYNPHCEPFGPDHRRTCLRLLSLWHYQHDQPTTASSPSVRIKQQKEELATAAAIEHAEELGLKGMVLYAGDQPVGFTFGEMLDDQTCSILIEKTDRSFTGSAQYIFSEFCRQYWSAAKWCNVGDDWEVPSLAWTKESYRPAYRIGKWMLRPVARPAAIAAVPALPAEEPAEASEAPAPAVESGSAGPEDLPELISLERETFGAQLALGPRQFRYLLRCPRATTHVLRENGHVIAEAVLLRRRTRAGVVARLYSIAVEPAHRGKGIGKALLSECLAALRQEDVAAVVLEVETDNAPAVALYEHAGFCRKGLLRDYYEPGRHAWKMRLQLSAAAPAEGEVAAASEGEPQHAAGAAPAAAYA